MKYSLALLILKAPGDFGSVRSVQRKMMESLNWFSDGENAFSPPPQVILSLTPTAL